MLVDVMVLLWPPHYVLRGLFAITGKELASLGIGGCPAKLQSSGMQARLLQCQPCVQGCEPCQGWSSMAQVTLEILELLLTYCRFHRASGRSDKVGIQYSDPAAGTPFHGRFYCEEAAMIGSGIVCLSEHESLEHKS